MKPRILIAGAGLCGLTAALALLQRGYDVQVFEQAAELREVGAGVQLGSNGTRVLIALGLEAAMRRIVCEPTGKEIRLWTTGQTWRVFDLGVGSVQRYGAPYWMAHRGDFHGVLLEAVRAAGPDVVRVGVACTGFTPADDSVTLHLANGEQVTGDVLLAADGVHSAIRRQMFGEGRARFTGIVAWRGLVPMHRLPPHMRHLVGTNWMGHGGHVVTYPLRRGELLNFVGVVERDDWQVESWTVEGTKGELANDFRGWHQDVHTLIDGIDTPYKWALMVRGPMERWTEGRISLLGDACHPTLPFLGQGAVMAIEDAYVVAACLSKYAKEPMAALGRYQDIRRDRTAAVVRKAHENRRQAFSPELADEDAVAISVAREWQQVRLRERMDWLYAYDATAVQI